MKTKIVVALLALGMLTGILMAVPSALGAPSITLDPPKYGASYVPGETLTFTVTILNTDPTTYDFVVVWDDGVAPVQNLSGDYFNNVDIPAPSVLSITENFVIPTTARDGNNYYVRVYDNTWIESGGTVGILQDQARFTVQAWTLSADFTRTRYLPGDKVTVIWSANMVRGGNLAPNGYGVLWAEQRTNAGVFVQLIQGPNWPFSFQAASGSYEFTLLASIPTTDRIYVQAYFNDTATNPDHTAQARISANVDGLRMRVTIPNNVYQPGAIVSTTILAQITDQAWPNDQNAPGASLVDVDVTVTDLTTGNVTLYGANDLKTDPHGNLVYVFQLGSSIAENTLFQIEAAGVANNAETDTATVTFTVRSVAGLSLFLTLNKSQYVSGETATATVAVSGSPGPFTYMYVVRDGNAGGPLLQRVTSDQGTYAYAIPAEYTGTLYFGVTADDGNGNRVGGSRTATVILGVLTLNLDRVEYNAGDTITASYALSSSALTGTDITYYYEVSDTSVVPNVLVKSGVATTGGFQYTVPGVPAGQYTFKVTASKATTSGGRLTLASQQTAYLVGATIGSSVAFLSISTDKSSYLPGETMVISYVLTARGTTNPLPAQVNFAIQIVGAPAKTVQTSTTSGDVARGTLTYYLPQGMNQGNVPLTVTTVVSGTSVTAVEIVTVGSVNPLMADWGGVPAISVVLLLLVILLILVMGIMWRRTAPGMAAPRPPSEKPAPPPPPTAAPGPAPMTVACKACGASIEITTSKRPIEVMCPSCGETQMVQ